MTAHVRNAATYADLTRADLGLDPTAYALKNDGTAKIERLGWVLYWSPARDVYVVRPSGVDRQGEGDEFTRLADAKRALRDFSRADRRQP